MVEALTVTLREGVEAALIVGIVLAYLNKIGRPDLRRVAYIGLGAAFLCSIAIAVVLSRLHFNQDIFEGVVMLVAAVFVVSMVIFMMRTAKKLKGEIEGRLHTLADVQYLSVRVSDGSAGGSGNGSGSFRSVLEFD
jgi:FTR1 family protein